MNTKGKTLLHHLIAAFAMILLFLPLKGMEVHAGDSISGYVNASAITASNIQLSGSTTINMDTDLELWTLRGPYDLTITGSGKLTVSSNSGPAIQAKQLRMENTGVFAYSADSNAIEVAEFLYAHDSWVEAKGVDSGIYVAWGNATFDNCMATIIATAYNGLYAYTNATFLGGNIYVEGNTCGVHVSGGDLDIDDSTFYAVAGGTGIYALGDIRISSSDVSAYGMKAIAADDGMIKLGDNMVITEPESGKVPKMGDTIVDEYFNPAAHVEMTEASVSSSPKMKVALGVEPLVYGTGQVYLHGSGTDWANIIDFPLDPGVYYLEAKPNPGCMFSCWLTSDGHTFSTDNPVMINLTSDLSLKVQFNLAMAFGVSVTGGTADKYTAGEGEQVTVWAQSPPTGKEFDHWEVSGIYIPVENLGKDTLVFNMPANTVSFEAVFIDAYRNYSFDANGGTGYMPGQTVEYGAPVVLPKPDFGAPSGKSFDHWEVEGKSYDPGDYLYVYDDCVIKAVWKSSAPAAASSTPPSPPSPPPHEHHYEWTTVKEATSTEDGVMYYMCTSCGHVSATQVVSSFSAFCEDAKNRIKNAPAGGTVVVMTDIYMSFSKDVMEALAARPDVNLVIQFRYEGIKFQVIVPAGYPNVMGLVNDGWAGFLFISSILGAAPVS